VELHTGRLEARLEGTTPGSTFQRGRHRGEAEPDTGSGCFLDQADALRQRQPAALPTPAEPEIANQGFDRVSHGPPMKIALTIAGSDSGGGAGIQADLKTFHQFGVFGTSAIVALTAQNTLGVSAVHTVPADMVEAQLRALADDLPPDALKSGMLATAALVRLVAAAISRFGWRRYVLDPVMVSTSGHRLLDPDAEAVLRSELLPLSALVTPNLEEAGLLVGREVRDPPAMEAAGRELLRLGAGAALVTGGHLDARRVTDVLVTPSGVRRFERPKLVTTSTHGTGCTLSAAIAAGLALGRELETAVADGLDFVHRAIAAAPGLGKGHGPLNHAVPAPPATGPRGSRERGPGGEA
jgi:hydroxymethylpyrimidine/phosphomethylpyrimidine kinase